jgi:hypothetical protein
MQEIECTTEGQCILKDSEMQCEVERMEEIDTSDKIGPERDKESDDLTTQETEHKTEDKKLKEGIPSDHRVTRLEFQEPGDVQRLQVEIIHSTGEKKSDDVIEQVTIPEDNPDNIRVVDEKEQEVEIQRPNPQLYIEDQGRNHKISDIGTVDGSKWPREGTNRSEPWGLLTSSTRVYKRIGHLCCVVRI